ncbi:hypothetical protein Hanom_Chr03g00192961 [Helianthus anomalus]
MKISVSELYLFLFSILKSTSLIFFRSNQSSLIQVSLQSIHESGMISSFFVTL